MMNSTAVCRTCAGDPAGLAAPGNTSSRCRGQRVFDQLTVAGESHSPAQMITACFSFPVTENDGLPEYICKICVGKLCAAYEFRLLCEKSFQLFVNSTSWKTEHIKIEKTDENSLDDDREGDLIVKISLKEELTAERLKEEDCSNFDDDNDEIYEDDDPSYIDPTYKNKKHKKHKLKKKYKEPFECTVCKKTFRTKGKLISHQDHHLGIKRYFCEICQKAYRTEKDHVNMHKRGFNHKCDICSKCFNTKAKLEIHKKTHSDDRERIPCDFKDCNKSFLSMNGLERHKMCHIGLKEFICHLCSKSFLDKYLLEIHLRRHTNERPFSCAYCSKKFITSSAKTSHEKWHINIKNYHCQYCGKGFVSSSGLKRHVLCHTNSPEEECRFCGKKFLRLDQRKRHEVTMHGVSDDIKPEAII